MSLGPIIYFLIAVAFLIYRKAKKEAEKEKPRPMAGQGNGPRKDGDFSPEEILRRILEAQNPNRKTVNPRPVTSPEADNRLPFEKRQAVEKTAMRQAKNREVKREMIDYDERAIQRLETNKSAQSERHKEPSKIHFHFNETETDPDIRDWLDLRKAIIGAEILRRPEY
jgi:hypothetical protein